MQCLGLLWQIIRLQLLTGVSNTTKSSDSKTGSATHMLSDLPPDQVLLRWMNLHLAAVGSTKRLSNFGSDLSDPRVFCDILHSFESERFPEAQYNEAKPRHSAETAVAWATELGVSVVVRPDDLCRANPKLNMSFAAQLFAARPSFDVPVVNTKVQRTQMQQQMNLKMPAATNSLERTSSGVESPVYNEKRAVRAIKPHVHVRVESELSPSAASYSPSPNSSFSKTAVASGNSRFSAPKRVGDGGSGSGSGSGEQWEHVQIVSSPLTDNPMHSSPSPTKSALKKREHAGSVTYGENPMAQSINSPLVSPQMSAGKKSVRSTDTASEWFRDTSGGSRSRGGSLDSSMRLMKATHHFDPAHRMQGLGLDFGHGFASAYSMDYRLTACVHVPAKNTLPIVRLIEREPNWSLHLLLRLLGVPYMCECVETTTALGLPLPVMIDLRAGHGFVLSGHSAAEHLLHVHGSNISRLDPMTLMDSPEEEELKGNDWGKGSQFWVNYVQTSLQGVLEQWRIVSGEKKWATTVSVGSLFRSALGLVQDSVGNM